MSAGALMVVTRLQCLLLLLPPIIENPRWDALHPPAREPWPSRPSHWVLEKKPNRLLWALGVGSHFVCCLGLSRRLPQTLTLPTPKQIPTYKQGLGDMRG